jgi:hypothetical protein
MINDTELVALFKSEAERRAEFGAKAPPEAVSAEALNAARDVGLWLMGAFVRETRPVIDSVRALIAPHGYRFTPLHPLYGRALALQIDLIRDDDGAQFAPLVFALDHATGELRAFVQQFDGREAPDFREPKARARASVDAAWLNDVLRDYVVCMLRRRRVEGAN